MELFKPTNDQANPVDHPVLPPAESFWQQLSGKVLLEAINIDPSVVVIEFSMDSEVVERKKLQPANALLSLATNGAFGLGGASAGSIVAFAGAEWAIAVDAGTFVLSAILVIQLRPRPQARSEPASMLRELREGWREFTSHRWLWVIVAQFSLVVAGWSGCFLIVGPVVAVRSFGGAAAWGWVAGALGVGLLVGGVLGMRLAVGRPMLVGTICVFGHAIPLLLLIAPAPVEWVCLGAFVAGVGGEMFGVLWLTALHTHVPPEALSRVSAYDILGSIALAPLGEAAAGPLLEAIGTGNTLWIGAALIVLPTLLVLGVREVRTLPSTAPPRSSAEAELKRGQGSATT